MKKRKVVIIIIAVFVLGAAACFFILGGNSGEAKAAVSTAVVEMGDLRQTVDIKSTVTGSDSASVYSTSSNRISQISVAEGDRVEKGQILAKLDSEGAALERQQAALTLSETKRIYDQQAMLYSEGAVAKAEVIEAENAYKKAALALELLNAANDEEVTSPISGTVTRVNTSVGKLAGGVGAEALFVIENLDKLQMKLLVGEHDIAKIKLGQKAIISSDILGKETVNGEVTSIAPTGEIREGTGNDMVIPVVVSIDKGESALIAGVTAKASIITGEVINGLIIPVDAIFEDSETDKFYVYIEKEGVLHKEEVSVLLEGKFSAAIDAEGRISEGDSVVLSPDYSLEDGMSVTVTE